MTSPRGALLDAPPLLGDQRPRVSSIPPYVSSAGQEAVDLAASAGLFLDEWQQWVLQQALGERVDGRWSAFEVGLIVPRQNGKGSVLEARELFGLILAKEELIIHSAHLFKTSKEAFRRILRLLEGTADLARKIKRVSNTHGDESIELTNGCRLAFVARSKGGGRGLSGDCLILDEAFALTDDQIEALMPVMSARDNGQIWYTSSPPLDAVTGEVLFNVRARGEAGDPVLAWMDWGQKRGVDLDDPRVHAAANPAYGLRIAPEAVERERRTMKDEGFGRERIGIWPETAGTAVISPAQWQALADPASRVGDDVSFAIDVTPARDHASIAVYSPRSDGLGHIELIDYRSGVGWLVARLAELKERHDPVAIAVDAKGPAGSLLADLAAAGIAEPEDAEKPQRGDLIVPGAADVAASTGQFLDAVTAGALRHLDQAQLSAAVAGAKTRSLGDAQAWARRTASSDISPLVAVTLARWAHLTRVDRIQPAELDPGAWYV